MEISVATHSDKNEKPAFTVELSVWVSAWVYWPLLTRGGTDFCCRPMDVDGWKQHCPKRVWCPAGVYGALGTPARGNTPGGRKYAMGWTDNNGNLWLFGGQGADADSK